MRALLASLALCACGDAAPLFRSPPSALERCLLDGGALAQVGALAPGLGPLAAIAGGAELVVGGVDGRVTAWAPDTLTPGVEPPSGALRARAGAALHAVAADATHVAAADGAGVVAAYDMGYASATGQAAGLAQLVDDERLAIGLAGDAVIAGTTYGQLLALPRAGGDLAPLPTTLWGVAAIHADAGEVFTAGHNAGEPQVERRAADAPAEVTDTWVWRGGAGAVRALATGGDVVVAAGEGFVAVLDRAALAAPRAEVTTRGVRHVGAVVLGGGALFATADERGALRVWDAATASQLTGLVIPAPVGLVTDAAGARLYTAGVDGWLRAYACR